MHATRFELARISPVELKPTALDQLGHTCLLYNKTISLNYFKNTPKMFCEYFHINPPAILVLPDNTDPILPFLL